MATVAQPPAFGPLFFSRSVNELSAPHGCGLLLFGVLAAWAVLVLYGVLGGDGDGTRARHGPPPHSSSTT